MRLVAITLCLVTASSCAQQHTGSVSTGRVSTSGANSPVVAGSFNTIVIGKESPTDPRSSGLELPLKLHDQQLDRYQVPFDYEKDPQWSPYKNSPHLLSTAQLQARVIVLKALRTYAQSLVDLNEGVQSKELDEETRRTGLSLISLTTQIGPLMSSIPSDRAGVPSFAPKDMVDKSQTSLVALGQYLASQKLRSAFPKIVVAMDPHIDNLCLLLFADITVMRQRSRVDFREVAEEENSYIRRTNLSPSERREEIRQLPLIIGVEQDVDGKLSELESSIHAFAAAHHALSVRAHSVQAERNQFLQDLMKASSSF